MVSRWRVIEAVALPMLTLLFLALWQGFRHHTDAIRALRLQLHELEQQQTEVNNTNLDGGTAGIPATPPTGSRETDRRIEAITAVLAHAGTSTTPKP